ncbi:hypothetical protein ACYOEI_01115 [Singulisphaera rosea]
MSELVVNGLVRKRAELAGVIDHTQAQLRQMIADVGSLDAAIRVFNPDYKLDGIKTKTFRPTRDGAKRGEMTRAVLEIIRTSQEPLTTRGVAERVTPGADVQTMKLTVKRVGLALMRQRDRRTIRAAKNEGREIEWSMA